VSRRFWLLVAAALVDVALAVLVNVFSARLPVLLRDWRFLGPCLVAVVAVAGAVGLLLERRDTPAPAMSLPGWLRASGLASLRPPALQVPQVRGRAAELAALYRLLRAPEGSFAVVCGGPGTGKTTVAAALAGRAEADGRAVFWLRWRTQELLTEQMTDVAMACGLPAQQLLDARAQGHSLPDLVWRQLSRTPGWLLVIDNADQPAGLDPGDDPVAEYRGWVRPGGRGLLVVTSRDRDEQVWGDKARLFHVAPLDEVAGGQVLTDLAPQAGDARQAEALAARLGGLPLALYAAGTYLDRPTARLRSFDGYRHALDERFGELLGAEDPNAADPDVARRLVRYTWDLSLDQLSAEGHPHARALLQLLALLADAPIPRSLVTGGLLSQATGGPVSEPAVDGALAGLHRYGLIDVPALPRTDSVPTVVLHPIVREVAAFTLTGEAVKGLRYRQAVHLRLLDLAEETARAGRAGWPTARLLAPHLPLLLPPPEPTWANLIAARDALKAVAGVLADAGEHAVTLGLRQVVLAAGEQTLGPDHPDILASRNNLANALDALGRYAEAAELHRRTLADRVRVLGPDHPDTLASRNNLAVARDGLGRYAEAAELHRQTLEDLTRVLGPDHRGTLASRNNLANARYGLGQRAEAAEMYRRTLDDQVRVLGPDHPDTLASRNNLANALYGLGRYAEAARTYRRTLEDLTRVLGPDHPDTLTSRNGLAVALGGLGRYAEAAELHRRTLADRVRVLGPDHPDTLASRNNLATVVGRLDRYAEVAEDYRRTLTDRMRVLGPDHPETLASRNNLAVALGGLGRYAEAAELHRRTLEDRVRVLGPDHPDTLVSRNNLAVALGGLGRYAEAAELHRRTLTDRERVLGPDHPDTLTSRDNLAKVLQPRRRRAWWWPRRRPG
jgi:tetratricopeptide (TPR) repeat protein